LATLKQEGYGQMIRPDHYYAIMSIMKYGSLALALNFAGKIVWIAVRQMY
jgi:hypothetical protein